MRIGIYVGSFNPPHKGHEQVVDYLLEKNIVDKILMLPTPSYWNKSDLVETKHRIEMLKFYEKENVEVDTKNNDYPYTYQVLNSIQKDYIEDELYLIIGSDNLEKLHEWQNIEDILKHKVIVLKRDEIIKNKNLEKYEENFIYINDFKFIDISSTTIRDNINNEKVRKYLNENVLEYITKNHLYNN